MSNSIKLYLSIPILLISIGVLWHYFGKALYLNTLHQTRQLHSVKTPKWLKLTKWEGQKSGSIYGMELEINGTSEEVVNMFFGPSKNEAFQEVKLKAGRVDFEYLHDWYSDTCYLYFPNGVSRNTDLRIRYRFMGDTDY